MMQDVGRRYVRIFNDVHKRTGTLWEGRYKAATIDSERYLVICQRYVELNPVRAALVAKPAAHRWWSYRYNAHGVHNPVVTPHELIQRLALNDEDRREAYRSLFKEPLAQADIDRLRVATNKGWPLGGEEFPLAGSSGTRPARQAAATRTPGRRAGHRGCIPQSGNVDLTPIRVRRST